MLEDTGRQQGAFTTVAPVRRGKVAALRALLEKSGTDVAEPSLFLEESDGDDDNAGKNVLRFAEVPSLHFCRFVLIPDLSDPDGASLLFSTNFDLPLDGHLDELISIAGRGLDRIYSHCQGYPWTGRDTPEAVKRFWLRSRIEPRTYFSGTYQRALAEIQRQAELHGVLQELVDELNMDPREWQEDPREIREEIREMLRERHPDMAWAMDEPPAVPESQRVRFLFAGALAVVRVALRGLALLPFLPKLYRLARDDADTYRKHLVDHAWLAARRGKVHAARRFDATHADLFIQNDMSHLTRVRPGRTRQLAIRFALEWIDFQARFIYRHGELGGIPSIHFARWLLIDGGRRLLFLTQYDGSWDSYLNDFIDQNGKGVAAMWSNTRDFPPTRGLWSLIPPVNVPDVKLWARSEQIPTQVWYSAYPALTVQNINNNSAIRAGLFGEMDREQAQAWLRRL